MHIAVVGAGSWGTAVARLVARNGTPVRLWSHGAAVAEGINENHRNPRYLSSCELPQDVHASTQLSWCLEGACAVVYVVPSSALREIARASAPFVDVSTPVVVLTKGIESGSGLLMTDVVAEEIGNPERVACLSGPNHAEEVSLDLPSASVIASVSETTSSFFQRVFHADTFRTYVSDDVVGVEICAAAKNVVAIACGIAHGLGMGDNTSALLMTRGLAEMSRLVAACGGNPMTCMGLAGMGDLVATCTSEHSRNQTFGAAFAAGESLASYEARTHMVVEGARACCSMRELAARHGVEVPLAEAVYELLYQGAALPAVVTGLYARTPGEEFYGLDAPAAGTDTTDKGENNNGCC